MYVFNAYHMVGAWDATMNKIDTVLTLTGYYCQAECVLTN